MSKSTFNKIENFDEEVIFCLERQMIPAWERHGLAHLAVSANTLTEFRSHPLPEKVQTSKKNAAVTNRLEVDKQ